MCGYPFSLSNFPCDKTWQPFFLSLGMSRDGRGVCLWTWFPSARISAAPVPEDPLPPPLFFYGFDFLISLTRRAYYCFK